MQQQDNSTRNMEAASALAQDLDSLLNQHFRGRVVRKDLTKQLKEGANVPVYVLEYLLGMYCASDDDEVVEQGLQSVKRILSDNYVRPDEAEKVKSLIRERGSYKIIDKVTVKLNQKKDVYEAQLSNLGIKDALVPSQMVKDNEKLLTGGIWCMITVNYFYEEGQKLLLSRCSHSSRSRCQIWIWTRYLRPASSLIAASGLTCCYVLSGWSLRILNSVPSGI